MAKGKKIRLAVSTHACNIFRNFGYEKRSTGLHREKPEATLLGVLLIIEGKVLLSIVRYRKALRTKALSPQGYAKKIG